MKSSATVRVNLPNYFGKKNPKHVFSILEADLYPISMCSCCWLGQTEIPVPWVMLLRGIFLWVFFGGAEQEQNSLQSLSCVQHMTLRRWWDGIRGLDSKLGWSSLLERCLLLPDPSCVLPNKYFSSLHSSDYALHWIQIKRQNVSLISTVMWDR